MSLDEEGARRAVSAADAETGLTADDAVRFGATRLVDAVLEHLPVPTPDLVAGETA